MKLQIITLYRDYGMDLLRGGGAQAAGGLISEGMGLLTQPLKNKQQLKQARRMQDLSLEGEATRLQRNKQYALDLWEATGYGAQVDQMKRAGINPALLYGMSGGGGQTANVPTGATTAGNAETAKGSHGSEGMGLMIGQMGLMKAQERNLNADSLNKEIDAKNKDTGGVVNENIATNTENLRQGITNAKITEKILEFERRMKKVDANIAEQTESDKMGQIVTMAEAAASLSEMIERDNIIAAETKQEKINQIRAEAIGAVLKNELTRAQTGKTIAEIQQVATEIAKTINGMAVEWMKMGLEAKKTFLQEKLINFQTAQSQRTYDNILKGLNTVTNMMPGKTVITPTADGGKTIITN